MSQGSYVFHWKFVNLECDEPPTYNHMNVHIHSRYTVSIATDIYKRDIQDPLYQVTICNLLVVS